MKRTRPGTFNGPLAVGEARTIDLPMWWEKDVALAEVARLEREVGSAAILFMARHLGINADSIDGNLCALAEQLYEARKRAGV